MDQLRQIKWQTFIDVRHAWISSLIITELYCLPTTDNQQPSLIANLGTRPFVFQIVRLHRFAYITAIGHVIDSINLDSPFEGLRLGASFKRRITSPFQSKRMMKKAKTDRNAAIPLHRTRRYEHAWTSVATHGYTEWS